MANNVITLRISNADDRLTVGTILLKHGYTVELEKLPKPNRKTAEIVLKACMKVEKV